MQTTREKSHLRLIKSSYQPGLAKAKRAGAGAAAVAPARSCTAYYKRLDDYAQRIRQVDGVRAIADILDQAVTETRAMEHHTDLHLTTGKLSRAELEIQCLKQELEQLRGLVHVDNLTGLLNRGGLQERYARESARADRNGKSFAVALLDIDNFKMLNDRYGHQGGDDALVHLAKTIRKTLRPFDIAVRYGGEEFLLIFPDANAEQATQALNRLQQDLDRQPLDQVAPGLTLTFSAGVANRGHNERRDAIIARADAAMYAAKRAGKRRVCTAPDALNSAALHRELLPAHDAA